MPLPMEAWSGGGGGGGGAEEPGPVAVPAQLVEREQLVAVPVELAGGRGSWWHYWRRTRL